MASVCTVMIIKDLVIDIKYWLSLACWAAFILIYMLSKYNKRRNRQTSGKRRNVILFQYKAGGISYVIKHRSNVGGYSNDMHDIYHNVDYNDKAFFCLYCTFTLWENYHITTAVGLIKQWEIYKLYFTLLIKSDRMNCWICRFVKNIQ